MMGAHKITDEDLPRYIELLTENLYPRSILVGIYICVNFIVFGCGQCTGVVPLFVCWFIVCLCMCVCMLVCL